MNTWLLPDGITESLPDDAIKHEALRRQLLDLNYRSIKWSYDGYSCRYHATSSAN